MANGSNVHLISSSEETRQEWYVKLKDIMATKSEPMKEENVEKKLNSEKKKSIIENLQIEGKENDSKENNLRDSKENNLRDSKESSFTSLS